MRAGATTARAYLAYWMAPLSFASDDLRPVPERDRNDNCRRLRLLCDYYGLVDVAPLPAKISDVLHHMFDEDATRQRVAATVAQGLRNSGHFAHWAREAAAIDAHAPTVAAALSARNIA